jgi:arylsulfatase A-like enzyme
MRCLGCGAEPSPATAKRPPNIIVVLADDLGLSVSCYGADKHETPHMDKLAATGVMFDRAYSQPICGPSRVSLMTGKYPFRARGTSPAKHVYFPRLLQQAGFATCILGKIGQIGSYDDTNLLAQFGFDEYMLWASNGNVVNGVPPPDRYWNPKYLRNGEVVQGGPDQYGPDLTHDYLVDFMRRNKDRPFFAFYSAVLPHAPYCRTPDSKRGGNAFADMVAYFDTNLVPAGKVCADLTDITDIYPTLLELAGVALPADARIDGHSIAPQILGKPGQPREWVYADIADSPCAETPADNAAAREKLASVMERLHGKKPEAAPQAAER